MNKNFDPNNKRSRDLTLVLLHSNGIPRSFRIRIPELQKNIFFLSVLFFISLIGMVVFASLYIRKPQTKTEAVVETSANREMHTTSSVAASSDPEFTSPASYKEELLKVQAELEQRKKLNNMEPSNAQSTALALLGSKSGMVSETEAVVKIKNPQVKRDPSTKITSLLFEIHNSTEGANTTRGHIVVLAKSPAAIYSYPPTVFAPNENILLNYAKGETFAISRFRQANAEFKNIADTNPLHFQIFLFSTNGKILATAHFEEGKK